MRTRRLFGLSVILALLLSMLLVPSAQAASTISSPPSPEVPLVDLTPGGNINFVGLVTTATGETPSKVQVGMDFNGVLYYSDSITAPAGTSLPYTIAVPTDTLIANCTEGTLTFEYWSIFESTSTPPITLACSVKQVDPPPTVVTPVLPTGQTEICGPNNDVVVIPAQPTGIVTIDSGWTNGTRTISFTAEPGFELAGATSAEFTDAATACPTETPTFTPEPTAPVIEPTDVPATEVITPVPVVTSLPATGTGSDSSSALIVLGTLAVVALVGTAGMYRRIRQ